MTTVRLPDVYRYERLVVRRARITSPDTPTTEFHAVYEERGGSVAEAFRVIDVAEHPSYEDALAWAAAQGVE